MAGTRQRVVQHGAQPGFGDRRRQSHPRAGPALLPRSGPASKAVISPARKQSPAHACPTTSDWRFFATCTVSPSRCSSQAPSGPRVRASHCACVCCCKVVGALQRGGARDGQRFEVVVAHLDEVGMLQGGHHIGAVGLHIVHGRQTQVGIHHHHAARCALSLPARAGRWQRPVPPAPGSRWPPPAARATRRRQPSVLPPSPGGRPRHRGRSCSWPCPLRPARPGPAHWARALASARPGPHPHRADHAPVAAPACRPTAG